ncbi:transposase, partial [Pseudomonas sp. Sample_10]|uniref:IS66-like element accessory protein TnpA n=1 Tax=Pseudomonas sp. Sample_10 TaxID=2448269 RepID=UPI0019D5175A
YFPMKHPIGCVQPLGCSPKYVDTIALIVRIAMRPRTSYPKLFKTQVVQECLQPGVSMASVALRHGINANLVRKWIPAYRDPQESALPAFVPMKLDSRAQLNQQASASIEVPFGQQKLTVKWPSSDPEGCARFIRELAQ